MKKLIALLFILFFCINSSAIAQFNHQLRKTVDSLVYKDRFYRILKSDLVKRYKKVDNIFFLKSKRYKAVQDHEIIDSLKQEYKVKNDSLSALLRSSDEKNLIVFEKIIRDYGFPGKKLVGHYDADRLLLHSDLAWIKKMFPLLKEEVKKGNLRAITLASAYDKFSYGEGKGYLYHTLLLIDKSNKITQTIPDDLEKTNAARKELGLKPIRIKKNGKRKG